MLYMSVDSIHCEEETNEVGSDEPYVIVTAVDLRNHFPGTPLEVPASGASLYGPIEDVDKGETHSPSFQAFWGLGGGEKELTNPDDAIFIAALMENDDGNAQAARGIVADSVSATLLQTIGFPRPLLVGKLIESIASAVNVPTGFPSTDEPIDQPKEIRFEKPELDTAETGQPVLTTLSFSGHGGKYSISFKARNRGQTAWRFCARCHAMFYDGDPANKGHCPGNGGGPHAPAGFMFFLPHDRSSSSGMDGRWRFCAKCFGMFKPMLGLGSAAGDPGPCPGGGRHEAAGFRFLLPVENPGPGQSNWTRCNKCRMLYWDGEANKGVCVADGQGHVHGVELHGVPSTNLKLDFEP
jgi:hypothetical protein